MSAVMFYATTVLMSAVAGLEFGEIVDRHVGCFNDRAEGRDLELEAGRSFNSVQLCMEHCTSLSFKYAGVQDGGNCFCGSDYGRYGVSQGGCNRPCSSGVSSKAACGGTLTNNIYRTGVKVPGRPSGLRLAAAATPTALRLEWNPPTAADVNIAHYILQVNLNLTSHPESSRFTAREMTLSNTTNKAVVIGLLAGSEYSVSVRAESVYGSGPAASALFWTEVGYPKEPRPPTIVNHRQTDEGRLHVLLHPVEELYGPITSYTVIVRDESKPFPFNNHTLYGYTRAAEEKLSYWVAAELEPETVQNEPEFIVGDNKVYGKYKNVGPLLPGHDYHVSLGAVSQLNGVTKTSYAKVSHDQHAKGNIIVFNFHDDHDSHDDHDHEDHDHDHEDHGHEDRAHSEDLVGEGHSRAEEDNSSGMDTALTVSLAVVSVLLLLALVVFVYLRYSLGRRSKQRQDTHQLTSNYNQGMVDPAENGYVDNEGFNTDEIRSAEEYLQSLNDKVWQIPRNFVDINNDVVARGQFCTVMKGLVQVEREPVNCHVYIVPNSDNLRMLRDLDLNIKAKTHANVVNLVGICEERDSTLLVLEPLHQELKQLLLDSRTLHTHPTLAHKADRFSSLREEDALALMLGIAQGLEHLVHCGVQVRELSSRSIYVTPTGQPKISGFGVTKYAQRTSELDLTRWKAPETLLKNQFSGKSLVWAYGCVIWEISTLGGSPYPGLKTREVKSRILQGLRLPQTRYVSAGLYQLMLTCWMTDPSERPDFASVRENLTEPNQQAMLSFSQYPGFEYEPFLPSLELLSPPPATV